MCKREKYSQRGRIFWRPRQVNFARRFFNKKKCSNVSMTIKDSFGRQKLVCINVIQLKLRVSSATFLKLHAKLPVNSQFVFYVEYATHALLTLDTRQRVSLVSLSHRHTPRLTLVFVLEKTKIRKQFTAENVRLEKEFLFHNITNTSAQSRSVHAAMMCTAKVLQPFFRAEHGV